MNACECNVGLSNTGRPNCVPIQSVTSTLILVPLVANDGIKNSIDLTQPVPTWSTLVNNPDRSKRWFPLPKFENVELPKDDSQFEEANSGRKAFLRQGKRSFIGELWSEDSTPEFLGKLKKSRCVDFGVFIVDVNGNLIGSKVGNELFPIPVDNSSFDPKFMFATDSTIQKIMVEFDFDRLFDESTMKMVTVSEAGINFNTLEGLIDVILTINSLSQTIADVDAKFHFGTAFNPLKFKGATATADWSITDGIVTFSPDAVTETSDGNYLLDFTTQSIGAGVDLTISVAKTGFEGEVEGQTV
jgi:hypothetical protein